MSSDSAASASSSRSVSLRSRPRSSLYDPYLPAARAAQLGIELVTIDELVERADFISVHLPKTKETAGLINAERLAKAKDGVIIVNAAAVV